MSLPCLYVGNLDDRVSEELLLDLFSHFGKIKTLKFIKNTNNNHNNTNTSIVHFAFVEYFSSTVANYAQQLCSEIILFNRTLRIRLREPLSTPSSLLSSASSASFSSSSSSSSNPLWDFLPRLYVGNLPNNIEESTLHDIFSQFSHVFDIKIHHPLPPSASPSPSPSSFAIVTLSDYDESDNAITALHGQRYANRILKVKYSHQNIEGEGRKHMGKMLNGREGGEAMREILERAKEIQRMKNENNLNENHMGNNNNMNGSDNVNLSNNNENVDDDLVMDMIDKMIAEGTINDQEKEKDNNNYNNNNESVTTNSAGSPTIANNLPSFLPPPSLSTFPSSSSSSPLHLSYPPTSTAASYYPSYPPQSYMQSYGNNYGHNPQSSSPSYPISQYPQPQQQAYGQYPYNSNNNNYSSNPSPYGSYPSPPSSSTFPSYPTHPSYPSYPPSSLPPQSSSTPSPSSSSVPPLLNINLSVPPPSLPMPFYK